MNEPEIFAEGDAYEYVNVSGDLIAWTRDARGEWHASDGTRSGPVTDQYMQAHVFGLLAEERDGDLAWRFTKAVFRQDMDRRLEAARDRRRRDRHDRDSLARVGIDGRENE